MNFVSFYYFNMATRKLKNTCVTGIMFAYDRALLEYRDFKARSLSKRTLSFGFVQNLW